MRKFNPKGVTVNEISKIYNRFGLETNNKNEKIFAKYLETSEIDKTTRRQYWIATHNNVPYDTQGAESHRERNLSIKLTKTNRESFNYYLQYLISKNSIYFTKASRSFINNA